MAAKKTSGSGNNNSGARFTKERVKTAAKRSTSSYFVAAERQLNDPYGETGKSAMGIARARPIS